MATLYISEYSSLASEESGRGIPIAKEPSIVDDTVTFTTSTASDAFSSATRYVRLIADADCHIRFGAAPTAMADNQLVPANTEIWRGVTPGHKVAAYDGSS